jgi:hypothetical protein
MLYLIAALLCLIQPSRPQHRFWWAIACLLLMLGISRLANVEQIVTNAGRIAAMRYGWYNTRHSIQATSIVGIVLSIGLIITCIFAFIRHLRAPEAIGILAMGSLLTLVSLRLISLHSVDAIVGRHLFGLFGVQLGWLVEILMLVCIVGASFWSRLQSRAASQNRSAA